MTNNPPTESLDRPTWHVRPDRGWMNDPNGLAHADGRYHVFFQYNPDSVHHGLIHWGHWSSPDLLNWQEDPIALYPRPGRPDSFGCWSGSAVVDGGVPTAVYSGVTDGSGASSVMLARSDSTWKEWVQDDEPVVPMPDLPGVSAVRDPFLFNFDGHRWAIQGAGEAQGEPRVLLWQCDDMNDWQFRGTFADTSDKVLRETVEANIWECPNLIQFGSRWALFLSVWRWIDGTHSLVGVRWVLGDITPEGDGLRFTGDTGGVLDEGPAFYAPQLLDDNSDPDEPRVLMWGWAWELDRTDEELERQGWSGILTCPREVGVSYDQIVIRPAKELEALRGESFDGQTPFRVASFEILAAQGGSLLLHDEETTAVTSWPPGSRILVDGSLVEVFSPSGSCLTTRAYPGETGRWSVTGTGQQVVKLVAPPKVVQ